MCDVDKASLHSVIGFLTGVHIDGGLTDIRVTFQS